MHVHLEPQNVALFGNGVFADVIKSRISRWDHHGFRVGPPRSKGRCLYKGKKREIWTQRDTPIQRQTDTQRGEGHVKMEAGASLVAQWLRIRLPMQGTRVRALVREDPICCGANKPGHHNYWACALEPTCHNYWACVSQLLSPHA